MDPLSRVMKIKTKIKKWDLIKLKSFCIAKKTIKKTNKQKDNPKNGRKSLQSDEQGINLHNIQTFHETLYQKE